MQDHSCPGPVVLTGVCLILLMLPACGGSGLNTVPVSGRVTYKGVPLTSGTITFSPQDQASGRAAWAYIDPGGRYSLTTVRMNDGALPGRYRVAVLAYDEAREDADKTRGRGRPTIPEKYLDHETSGLTATVESRTTTLDFDLK
jgi:hypothetical protein